MTEQLQLWGNEPSTRRLRWSLSRDKRLRDCRKYYLFHYGSRGAHLPDAPKEARELYILKSLQNRHMWVGGVVHDLIELALNAWRRSEETPVEALIERGTRIMRANYAESIQRIYRERPMRACGFIEHEYNESVTREEWRKQRDLMEQCIRNFYQLEIFSVIKQIPLWQWFTLETLGSFDLIGTTIVVKPDFAWRDDNDRVVLVDWKTGVKRPEQENLQLAVYGLYARRAWGLYVDNLKGLAVYLRDGQIREQVIGFSELKTAEELVSSWVDRMRNLDQQPIEAFKMTTDLSHCQRCNFKRVCGREEAP